MSQCIGEVSIVIDVVSIVTLRTVVLFDICRGWNGIYGIFIFLVRGIILLMRVSFPG